MRAPLHVIFSIDVEEEGLFRGEYQQFPTSFRNVTLLHKLEKITAAHKIPLTLLCDYPVLTDSPSREILLGFRERGAALGLHLHHWNTPPFQDSSIKQPVPSVGMQPSLLAAKMDALFEAFAPFHTDEPVSFRMGRWDFSAPLRDVLIESPVQIDSSITPYRPVASQMDHFLSEVSPYWISPPEKGTRSLLECPLTLHPLSSHMAQCVYRMACKLPESSARKLLRYFRLLFVVGVQPVWYPLFSMKWATMFHVKHQESFLVMFMHSSELLPGANPVLPDQDHVDALLRKIDSYLSWLHSYVPVKGITFPQAYSLLSSSSVDFV